MCLFFALHCTVLCTASIDYADADDPSAAAPADAEGGSVPMLAESGEHPTTEESGEHPTTGESGDTQTIAERDAPTADTSVADRP